MTQQVINRGTFDNDPSAETIRSAFGDVNANFTELYRARGHSVLDYGAVGDSDITTASGTNDAAAFQSAIDASETVGGIHIVDVPGGKTYRIGSSLNVTQPIWFRGVGASNNEDTAGPPRLVWSGAQDGILIDLVVSDNNITNVVFSDIFLGGRSDNTNLPGNLIKISGSGGAAAKPDTGTGFKNVWFFNSRGHAINLAGKGATNLWIDGCRWDQCGTQGAYGIYVDLVTGFSCYIGGHTTFTCEAGAGGFIWMDCEAKTTGTPFAMLQIDSCKIEIGGSLAETYAGGTNNYDKRGIIRLGTNGVDLGNITHSVFCDALEIEAAGGQSSMCVFHVTATGGTDVENTRMVNIIVDGGSGLGSTSDSAAATDVIRPIGGRIATARRPGALGAAGRWGRFQFGTGRPGGYGFETVTSWIHSLRYQVDYHISGPMVTVANLEGTVPLQGMRATVTDANATTFHSVVAGGGANVVPVFYDGTNWRIG